MPDVGKSPARKPAAKKKAAPRTDAKADAPSKKPGAQKTDAALKDEILAAALLDAGFDGFTEAVLEKAGQAAAADKAALARLFPDGPLSLVEFYSLCADAEMEERLAAMDLPAMKVRARIRAAVKTRLAVLRPHKEAARRAAALLSLPMHAGLATKLLYRTVDAMWRATGDTSTDFNFYTKRAILVGIYGATTLCWFNDNADSGTDSKESATDTFLDARIENVMQFEKFKAGVKKALANFPAFANWAKTSK